MNALERAEIGRLELRLFGEDGQGGAFGEMKALLTGHDSRLHVLETDKIARDAANAAVAKQTDSATSARRWRITAIVATLALVVSSAFGVIRLAIDLNLIL